MEHDNLRKLEFFIIIIYPTVVYNRTTEAMRIISSVSIVKRKNLGDAKKMMTKYQI